jgi:hypothetical protein
MVTRPKLIEPFQVVRMRRECREGCPAFAPLRADPPCSPEPD